MFYNNHCELLFFIFFFFNDTATTEIYTLSLHDALPIWLRESRSEGADRNRQPRRLHRGWRRSEEHTSELQSQSNLVCRLLLEKKKKTERSTVRQLINDIEPLVEEYVGHTVSQTRTQRV